MKIGLLLILAICSIAFSNCKKNDKKTSGILTSRVWKAGFTDKNLSTNPPGNVLYSARLDCERDDLYKFGSNGKLTLDRGKNKCNEAEVRVEHQDYTIDRETKKLVIRGIEYTLAEESRDQIKYYAPLPPTSSQNYQYIIFLLQ